MQAAQQTTAAFPIPFTVPGRHSHANVAMASKQVTELVDVLHISPICTKLGLGCLACLATCSKATESTIEKVFVRDSLGLLDHALNSARCSEQQQHTQAAAWLAAVLLRKAPAIAAEVTERLLHLPSVPLATARQLVAAGVRITNAQLLGAARTMVAGVEVWVQAQHELGIQTDVPALAVRICCGDYWVSDGSTQLLVVASDFFCRDGGGSTLGR
jgi:hypothetical protein